jgi:HEAT repeat protein
MEFPDDVDDLLERAILGRDLGGPSPYEDVLHRDLLFAMRCLADQDVSPALTQRLVQEFVQAWLHPPHGRRYESLGQQARQIAQAARGSAAERILTPRLLTALRDESADVRYSAAQALSQAAAQPDAAAAEIPPRKWTRR